MTMSLEEGGGDEDGRVCSAAEAEEAVGRAFCVAVARLRRILGHDEYGTRERDNKLFCEIIVEIVHIDCMV